MSVEGFSKEELNEVKFYQSVTIDALSTGRSDWSAPTLNVGGHEFVEMVKGDRKMQAWLVGVRAYSTRAAAVIFELCKIQSEASKAELDGDDGGQKGDISEWRQKRKDKALKLLQEGSANSVVEVVLPSFISSAGQEIAADNTVMPLNVNPIKAMVKLTADVMTRVFLRADSVDIPEKRAYTPSKDKDNSDKNPKRAKTNSKVAVPSPGTPPGTPPEPPPELDLQK